MTGSRARTHRRLDPWNYPPDAARRTATGYRHLISWTGGFRTLVIWETPRRSAMHSAYRAKTRRRRA